MSDEAESKRERAQKNGIRLLTGSQVRQLKNHENLVGECWIAEGSDLARQDCHDRNFQGAGQRSGNDAHAKLGGRSTSGSHCPRWRYSSSIRVSVGALRLLV